MYSKYKIVVNTAAGRRRYMQYLIPYIVASTVVDRYDIWINTHNGADIEFFKQVAKQYPVVNLVWQPDGIVNGNASINAFYRQCIEPDTIYFKLDDDIVWMEPGLIEKMVKFRIDNPEYFLVSPLVINNSLCTYLLQIENKIELKQYFNADSSHSLLWKSGKFALDLHKWFINKYLKPRKWQELYMGCKPMGMTRFSINAILWWGDEMSKIRGIIPGDDEEFLSCIYPTQRGLANAWNGDAIVAHFAFFTQREHLDAENILDCYGCECHEQWRQDEIMAEINQHIQSIMSNINADEPRLMLNKSPYHSVAVKQTLKKRVKKYMPSLLLQLWNYYDAKMQQNADYIC